MKVELREFTRDDIPNKVRWINDPENNRFLHYDLPLTEEGTARWLERIEHADTRLDMTILCDGIAVGIIGLLQIDRINGSAELYITVGEHWCKGKGIAGSAVRQLMQIGFDALQLQRIWLKTETENAAAVRAYEKLGFTREGCLRNEVRNNCGDLVSRYVYSMLRDEFEGRYGKN